jgi:ankyrin repeat protein
MTPRIFLLIISICLLTTCYDRDKKVDKSRLIGMDYRLFQDSPAWELAKAVEDGNVKEIERQVKEEKVPVDFREERFGQTLLMMAVMNENVKSVEMLLKLGADPNAYNNRGRNTPVILASGIFTKGTTILKPLLDYGGNPNSEDTGLVRTDIMDFHSFALLEAAHNSLDKVKLLVESGADVNKTDSIYHQGALEISLYQHKMNIALYLLQKGADYNKKIYQNIEGGKYSDVLYVLRKLIFPLNSQEYREKMQVVDFLKSKGLDYRNSPISDGVYEWLQKRYPDTWQEYLKVY